MGLFNVSALPNCPFVFSPPVLISPSSLPKSPRQRAAAQSFQKIPSAPDMHSLVIERILVVSCCSIARARRMDYNVFWSGGVVVPSHDGDELHAPGVLIPSFRCFLANAISLRLCRHISRTMVQGFIHGQFAIGKGDGQQCAVIRQFNQCGLKHSKLCTKIWFY